MPENATLPAPVVWNLQSRMHEAGFRRVTQLHARLVDLMGDDAPSYEHVSRVVREQPINLSLTLLAGLCDALGCEPGDLLVRPGGDTARGAIAPEEIPARMRQGLFEAAAVVGRPVRRPDAGVSHLLRERHHLDPLMLDVALHEASGRHEQWESIPTEDLERAWTAFQAATSA